MRNLKRFAALGLASAMLLSLVACGSTDEGKSSEESKSVEASKSTTPASEEESEVSEEPIEMTFWVPESPDLDWDTCTTTLALEEKFNVDMKFQVVSATENMGTLYNLMLASKENVPDVMLHMGFDGATLTAGIEAGLLLPLTDYIVEGTTYYEALQENPSWRDIFTAPDGNIYTFMYTDVGVHTLCKAKMWYRAEWVEKLGWDAPPSTPEEFKQYLIDIRDKDVNGNGDPNDEIPLMGLYGGVGATNDPICFLMNPFELYCPDFHYITDDGELYFTATTDGWRKGLAYIADLYAEGLIAEETYVQDGSAFKSVMSKTPDEALVGVAPGWRVCGYLDMNMEGSNFLTYQALAPLKGDYQQAYAGNFDCLMRGAITTECEHPELAFEIMDYLISEEGSFFTYFGPEGGVWNWVDEESYIGTTPAVKKFVTDNAETRKHVWYVGCPKIDNESIRYGIVLDKENLENDAQWELLSQSKIYEPYHVNTNIPYSTWADPDVMNRKNDLGVLINEYIWVADTEFVMGIRDINDDAQWEAYLKDLEDMGLQEYLETLEIAYGLK